MNYCRKAIPAARRNPNSQQKKAARLAPIAIRQSSPKAQSESHLIKPSGLHFSVIRQLYGISRNPPAEGKNQKRGNSRREQKKSGDGKEHGQAKKRS